MLAKQILIDTLTLYGLGSLVPTADRILQENPDIEKRPDMILPMLADTPEYKERFKGNEARIKAGLPALDPGTYIATENALRQTLRASGLPRGFYDTETQLRQFIEQDISPNELSARVNEGYRAALNAPQQVRDELQQLYGLTESDLAAYYLDPTVAVDVLRTRTQAAQIAAQARQQTGSGLLAQQAEELARQGVTEAQAREGFSIIAQQQGLFEAQMAGEQAVSREEQIAGTFGTSAAAQQRIATRRRRRQAEFEAGGGFAAGQGGVIGLQTAQ